MPEEFCTYCDELAWQCSCPPEPDEVINPTPDDYYDEPEGMSFEDALWNANPLPPEDMS